jgi:hypothetical protein
MKIQLYFSSYFYLSHDIKAHFISSSTLIDILASIGGLHRIIKILFKFIGGKFNSRVLTSKLMRNMYFLKKSDAKEHTHSHYPNLKLRRMQTSFFTHDLTTIHTKVSHVCWCRRSKEKQKNVDKKMIFDKGSMKLTQDLSVTNIL